MYRHLVHSFLLHFNLPRRLSYEPGIGIQKDGTSFIFHFFTLFTQGTLCTIIKEKEPRARDFLSRRAEMWDMALVLYAQCQTGGLRGEMKTRGLHDVCFSCAPVHLRSCTVEWFVAFVTIHQEILSYYNKIGYPNGRWCHGRDALVLCEIILRNLDEERNSTCAGNGSSRRDDNV